MFRKWTIGEKELRLHLGHLNAQSKCLILSKSKSLKVNKLIY